MKKKLLTLGIVLALVMALVIPAAAMAAPQQVTGSTVSAYIVGTTVIFGQVAANSDKTMADVVTASYNSTVTVTAANTTAGYVTGVLTKLEYLSAAGTVLEATITAPAISGADEAYDATVYASGNEITMADTEKLALKAYTGAVTGTWNPVELTLTVAAP